MDKRGIELSLSFIVVIIISIVIFGFGIRFMAKLFSQANALQDLTSKELDERIGNLICEGSERVCIGIDRKKMMKNEIYVFGLKIINILDSQNFEINVSHPEPIGYKKDKQPIQKVAPFNGLIIKPAYRTVLIAKNEEKNLGIGIQVPSNAVSGTYILNVEIKTEDGELYSTVQKIYVDVP